MPVLVCSILTRFRLSKTMLIQGVDLGNIATSQSGGKQPMYALHTSHCNCHLFGASTHPLTDCCFLQTALMCLCRDAVKKAVESLKSASHLQDTSSNNLQLLDSLSVLEQQIQTAPAEALPALLEGVLHAKTAPFI